MKNDNRKLNTIVSYPTKKFGIEYQGFLLRFCTHRNEFNCVFTFTKLRNYAIRSLIWSYVHVVQNILFLLSRNNQLMLKESKNYSNVSLPAKMQKIYGVHKLVGLQLFWSRTPTFASGTSTFLPDGSPELLFSKS